ncbi:MAG: hypothetical protein AAF986_04555 [Pseudomonadota bacterium]
MILSIQLVAAFMVTIAGPQERYLRYFLGEYAQMGQCGNPEKRWTLGAREINHGLVACEIQSIDDDHGVLVIRTRNCTQKGDAVRSITYKLDLVSTDAVQVSNGKQTAMLRRCN